MPKKTTKPIKKKLGNERENKNNNKPNTILTIVLASSPYSDGVSSGLEVQWLHC